MNEPRIEEKNSHVPRATIKARFGNRGHTELCRLEQLWWYFEAHDVGSRRERQEFSESHVLLTVVGDKVVVRALDTHRDCLSTSGAETTTATNAQENSVLNVSAANVIIKDQPS